MMSHAMIPWIWSARLQTFWAMPSITLQTYFWNTDTRDWTQQIIDFGHKKVNNLRSQNSERFANGIS